MSITIEHLTEARSLTLYNGQQSNREVSNEVDSRGTYTDDSDERLLSNFTAGLTAGVTGIAAADRLSNQSNFSNDRVTALAEFAAELSALVSPLQGDGWRLTDEPRGKTVDGYVTDVTWTRNEREPYTMQYNLQMRAGEGMGEADLSQPVSVTPGSSSTLDGIDLGALQTWSESRRLGDGVKSYELTFESPEEATLRIDSAVVREIEIRGRPTDTRDDIDDKVDALAAQDQTVVYDSAFPGASYDVMVDRYDGVRSQEYTNLGEYSLTLQEGRV